MFRYERRRVFWNATIEEQLSNGFIYNKFDEEYVCLLCSKAFDDGIIYEVNGTLYKAKRAILQHIEDTHTSVFDYLISLDKKYTGLSEHQKELLQYFDKDLTDKEIIKIQNGGSPSTIRNHRFKLKEKEKQAKVFIAIMNLLHKNSGQQKGYKFVNFHKRAKMMDNRYAITEDEKKRFWQPILNKG